MRAADLSSIDTDGLAEALEARSEPTPSGCREWRLSKARGYGQIEWRGKMRRAHRLALFLVAGPPPPDKPFALHHCDNPACIASEHLYWGDQFDNMADREVRGRGPNSSKTHCKWGHPFDELNTYYDPARSGHRRCKECNRLRAREWNRQHRGSS
jgi:hypothetical protein